MEGLLFLLFKYVRNLVDFICTAYKYIFHISKTLFLI